jgi:hypothetical protein
VTGTKIRHFKAFLETVFDFIDVWLRSPS